MTTQPAADEVVVWNGPDDLVPLLVPLASVEVDPRNARRHPEVNLRAIVTSLRAHGQLKPIVVKGSRILAGNGTWAAARELGWNAIAVVRVPAGMSDEEAVAYAIADNKTTDLSDWDNAELAALFREMPPELHPLTGFDPSVIEPLLRGEAPPEVQPIPAGPLRPPSRTRNFTTFVATEEQAAIIRSAIDKVKSAAGDGPEMSDGRALELVSADYLAGA